MNIGEFLTVATVALASLFYLLLLGAISNDADAAVLCGDNVLFGSNVFPCDKGAVSTTSTTTTYTTTTTHKTALPPSIYLSRGSRVRNMSYDYTEPPKTAGCDPIVCGFFGWLGRIFS
jgi:hypothetical protein